ncbi:MAG: zinc-dependent alcohol dehydrogenase family protein [Armatimonadota bacterium]
MRAMRLERVGAAESAPLILVDQRMPEPGPGQLLLQVKACGVCRTDLHIVEGDLALPKLPLVPGHEVVAKVAEIGAGVKGFRVGQRVGVPWLHSTPEDCLYRQRGLENLCPDARFTGYHVDGGYAEYMLSEAEFTYPLPGNFEDAEAAPLLCAGVIGYRALKLSGLQPGWTLAVYGFGGSAHITIQIALKWGCQVQVFTRAQRHRRHAEELGAQWVGGLQDEPPGPSEAAINFTPAGEVVLTALRNLRPGGTVCCAGIYQTPIPEMEYGLLYGERVVRSAANSTREDVRELLAEAERIPVRTTVTEFPLEKANEALVALKNSEFDGAAVLVM